MQCSSQGIRLIVCHFRRHPSEKLCYSQCFFIRISSHLANCVSTRETKGTAILMSSEHISLYETEVSLHRVDNGFQSFEVPKVHSFVCFDVWQGVNARAGCLA